MASQMPRPQFTLLHSVSYFMPLVWLNSCRKEAEPRRATETQTHCTHSVPEFRDSSQTSCVTDILGRRKEERKKKEKKKSCFSKETNDCNLERFS